MKVKRYDNSRRGLNGFLHQGGIRKKSVEMKNRFDSLPYVVLCNLSSFLYGFDALSFAEVALVSVMDSERQFWRSLGTATILTEYIDLPLPNHSYYLISANFFVQLLSARFYSRFVYNAFRPERLLFLTNCCNTDSFRTYARLQSYTSHHFCYNLPVFSFLKYSFMYTSRPLNRIEMLLFRICRNGNLNGIVNVVEKLEQFEANLNNKFGFSSIKKLINFSLFVLAGGAVLNSLLIHGFDSSDQDLDFFWLGGTRISFINAIKRFKRKASNRILQEKNTNGKVVEFILLIENNKKIRIQFIFARVDANVSFILYTFDIDVVQVAYNGRTVISTIGFFQAIATGSFICYNLTNSIYDAPLYIDRCLKYNARGFNWICPIMYDETVAQKPLISSKQVIDYGFNDFYYNVDSFNIQHHFLSLNVFE